MAMYKDGVTELLDSDEPNQTIDNVIVLPLRDGEADLILAHTLEEANGIVLKAQVVGRWHFDSAEHLQYFSNMLTESIKKSQQLTDEELDINRAEFESSLKRVSRKQEPEQ